MQEEYGRQQHHQWVFMEPEESHGENQFLIQVFVSLIKIDTQRRALIIPRIMPQNIVASYHKQHSQHCSIFPFLSNSCHLKITRMLVQNFHRNKFLPNCNIHDKLMGIGINEYIVRFQSQWIGDISQNQFLHSHSKIPNNPPKVLVINVLRKNFSKRHAGKRPNLFPGYLG